MKKLLYTAPFLALAALAPSLPVSAKAAPAEAETYAVDPGHSGVLFRVKHLGVSYFHGRFNEVGGEIVVDRSDFTKGSVTFEIQAASVDTNSTGRDDHLKSADFLDVGQFPVIRFESTKIEPQGDDRYTLTGTLDFHGVQKEIEADMTYVGAGDDPWGGYRTGYEATFTIQRSDFGMTYFLENGGLGDDIDITVFVEAMIPPKEEG